MTRSLLLALCLSGCAALIDPAHHGTAAMQRAWARADLCVQVCDASHPNDKMVITAPSRSTDGTITGCACQTTHVNMGASYYANDHAAEPVDQYEYVKILTPLEVLAELDAAAKANAEAARACAAKWKAAR